MISMTIKKSSYIYTYVLDFISYFSLVDIHCTTIKHYQQAEALILLLEKEYWNKEKRVREKFFHIQH